MKVNRKLKKEKMETYKNARETLLSKLTEWGQRLNGQDFHGGNLPDEADFEVPSYDMADFLALRTPQDQDELEVFPDFHREEVPREVLQMVCEDADAVQV
jgi:hypothetical protein